MADPTAGVAGGEGGQRLAARGWRGVLWISVAFPGRYGNTYGGLAGVVVLLLWMYVSSFIVLTGAEINAEAERDGT